MRSLARYWWRVGALLWVSAERERVAKVPNQ
jgi:hypothetical protein